MLIYISGPLGYETAYRLYEENIVRIKKQFPTFFINQFLEIPQNMGDFNIEKCPEGVYSREILRTGLFGCLWTSLEELSCGCEICLKNIKIRQEVIEILELFKESPYEVSSKGSFLLISDEPLNGACLIGFTNNQKSRIINFGDHKRFLTPPGRQAKDEAYRKGKIK